MKLLSFVEKVGNRLPHPFWMFCWLILLLVPASALLEGEGARSLLSIDALRWFALEMVGNFSRFAPLGVVLIMLMGVSIAESSGLIAMLMRAVALGVPQRLVVPVLFATSACSTLGSDAGVVVMPPLAAAVFRKLGRSPIAGLLVGYAGATTGYTANFFPTGTDVIAMALTNEASGHRPEIGVLANYWFKVGSLVWMSLLGTFVTLRFVEPRFARVEAAELSPISPSEKRGLLHAAAAVALVLGLWIAVIAGAPNPLRGPTMVTILFSLFVIGGLVYGRAEGTVKSAADILRFMTEGMKRIAPYIVLVFVISQFIEIFQYAMLDQLAAREGAAFLRGIGFDRIPILFFVVFVCCVAVVNVFIGSSSAKWAIFAPIFVPMFMALGYHPAFAQLLYRIGDSATDGITPLSPFFPLLVGWIAEHDEEKAKVGTILSYLLPYALVMFPGWILLMIVWYLVGLPIGPDSPIHLAP